MTFDRARLIAATAVVFSHCFPVLGIPEPLQALGGPTIGTIAVWVFFAISGYLVTGSWLSEPKLWRFVLKRAARILPALLCVLTFALLLGAELTTSPDYWRDARLFSVKQPGVFLELPYPGVMNGSLWSLVPEAIMYGFVAAVGVFGWLRRSPASVVAAAMVFFAIWDPRFHVPFALFFLAMMAQLAFRQEGWLQVTEVDHENRTISFVGASRPRRNDYSYGIFLWSFPLQQLLVRAIGVGPDPNWLSALGFFATSMLVTLPVAALSWHLVEKPVLNLVRRA